MGRIHREIEPRFREFRRMPDSETRPILARAGSVNR